jgi:membrane-bound lytic murein transglycosylase B
MKSRTIALIVFLAAGAVLGLTLVSTALGFRTDCVTAEAGIEAQYKANQSQYDNMWKSFREMTQVSSMYADQLKEVFEGVIKGRYGAEGSKQLVLLVKEDNPKVDPSMYTKIQAAIEAGRTRFNQSQAELLDRKRQYEVILKSNTGAVVNVLFGFPHIDLAQYDIVTSEQTEKTFKEKKSDEIKLR